MILKSKFENGFHLENAPQSAPQVAAGAAQEPPTGKAPQPTSGQAPQNISLKGLSSKYGLHVNFILCMKHANLYMEARERSCWEKPGDKSVATVDMSQGLSGFPSLEYSRFLTSIINSWPKKKNHTSIVNYVLVETNDTESEIPNSEDNTKVNFML